MLSRRRTDRGRSSVRKRFVCFDMNVTSTEAFVESLFSWLHFKNNSGPFARFYEIVMVRFPDRNMRQSAVSVFGDSQPRIICLFYIQLLILFFLSLNPMHPFLQKIKIEKEPSVF